MVKSSVKQLRKPKDIYRYSIYMQTKDSAWLNRNLNKKGQDEEPEPIEEDIRD